MNESYQKISPLYLIIFSLSGLIALGWYGIYFNEKSDALDQKKYHAANLTGETVCIAYITIISRDGDLYTGIDRRGRRYLIDAGEFQPTFYNSYAFSGKKTGRGYLQAYEMDEYPFRKWKYSLSLLSVLLVAWLVFRHLRIDTGNGKFYFR